jgi:hypothetical protein
MEALKLNTQTYFGNEFNADSATYDDDEPDRVQTIPFH